MVDIGGIYRLCGLMSDSQSTQFTHKSTCHSQYASESPFPSSSALHSRTCFNMKFDGRAGISVAELIVYLPALIVATVVCIRHGFDRSSGWIFALVLCLVRIVGACCQFTTYHNQSVGLLEATIILESIGISPLLLATLGLLSRWSVGNSLRSINSERRALTQFLVPTPSIRALGWPSAQYFSA